MGQTDGIGQPQNSQVVVVRVRVVMVVGEDVGHGAHLAARVDDEETVISACDGQEDRVNDSGGGRVHDTVGSGKDVVVVEQDTLAVKLQGSVQGAVGGELSN